MYWMQHDYFIDCFERAGALDRTEENFMPVLARMGAVKPRAFIFSSSCSMTSTPIYFRLKAAILSLNIGTNTGNPVCCHGWQCQHKLIIQRLSGPLLPSFSFELHQDAFRSWHSRHLVQTQVKAQHRRLLPARGTEMLDDVHGTAPHRLAIVPQFCWRVGRFSGLATFKSISWVIFKTPSCLPN